MQSNDLFFNAARSIFSFYGLFLKSRTIKSFPKYDFSRDKLFFIPQKIVYLSKSVTFVPLNKIKSHIIIMNKELPKIDLPEEWIIGTGINKELLNLYKNFPCRLKAEIFVLCMGGEIEASINLNRITVRANDFVTIMPGNILQIHSVKGEPTIYFGGFSSKYIEQANLNRSTLNTLFVASGRPVITLKPQGAKLLEEYFLFLIKLYDFFSESTRQGLTQHLYNDIHTGIDMQKLHPARHAELQPYAQRGLVCRKAGHHPYAPLHHRQAGYGKHLCGNHLTHGYHGCQIATQIHQLLRPKYLRLAQLPQRIVLREILQTLCRHEPPHLPQQRIDKASLPLYFGIMTTPSFFFPSILTTIGFSKRTWRKNFVSSSAGWAFRNSRS